MIALTIILALMLALAFVVMLVPALGGNRLFYDIMIFIVLLVVLLSPVVR